MCHLLKEPKLLSAVPPSMTGAQFLTCTYHVTCTEYRLRPVHLKNWIVVFHREPDQFGSVKPPQEIIVVMDLASAATRPPLIFKIYTGQINGEIQIYMQYGSGDSV